MKSAYQCHYFDVKAPLENEAIQALKTVQGLSPDALELAINEQVGDSMMQVMVAMVRSMHPDDDDAAVGDKVHLMLLCYLMAQAVDTPEGAG